MLKLCPLFRPSKIGQPANTVLSIQLRLWFVLLQSIRAVKCACQNHHHSWELFVRLVYGAATLAAEIKRQAQPTFMHTSMLRGGAIRDVQTVLWKKQIQCICAAADLPTR